MVIDGKYNSMSIVACHSSSIFPGVIEAREIEVYQNNFMDIVDT